MKKFLLILITVTCSLTAGAADYGYLIIRQLDGSKSVFPSTGLTFKIHDGILSVNDSSRTESFSISTLESMVFSKDTTGIEAIFNDDSAVEVFDTSGCSIGCFSSPTDAMDKLDTPGVYIFRNNSTTVKIRIR